MTPICPCPAPLRLHRSSQVQRSSGCFGTRLGTGRRAEEMAVEDTQESQWQAIFDKVKNDCPDKKHVLHRHAKDEPEKAKDHFTGCPQASENGPTTEQHASAYPAPLPIGKAQPCVVASWALNQCLTNAFCVSMKISGNRLLRICAREIAIASWAKPPSIRQSVCGSR